MRSLVVGSLFVPLLLVGCAVDDPDGEEVGSAKQAGQVLVPETDGNDTPATATPLAGRDGVAYGNITPFADNDYYAITAAAGDKLYVATMSAADPVVTNTIVGVYASDGTTLLEEDDDNGSFSTTSSALGGVTLATAGTYYIRVRNSSTGSTIRPYNLHWTLRGGVPTPEAEPNDDPATAPAGQPWILGSLSAAADLDFYPLTLAAGDTVYIALDADPERDASDTLASVGFGPFANVAGSYIILNDTGGAGADAEGAFFTVATAGTYNVRVAGTGAGTYGLSIAVRPAAPVCTTYTSAATPVAITDNATTTTTITVPGNPIVDDLDVSVAFTHAAPADLDVTLTSPAGNTIGLFNDIGTAVLGGITANLDDEAAYPINFVSTAVGVPALRYQPQVNTATGTNRLNHFDGVNAGGVWTLTVADDAAGTAGSLTSFNLTICARQPVCAAGTAPVPIYFSNFEADNGGLTHSGTSDEWEYGTPTFAPITTCASGTRCWKTDLDNTYNTSSTQDLVTPPISLVGAVGPVYAQWSQKYQIESANWDHLYAAAVPAVGPERRLFEHFAPDLSAITVGAATVQTSAGWATMRGDLSPSIGSTVQLKFHLDGDSSTNYAGYAVDDVGVFACSCGNGGLSLGELCDDGNLTNGDGCDSNCTVSACGNGVAAGTEACDDGNLVSGDGCDSNCTITACRNGVITAGEICDDGNNTNGDGCDSNCTVSACGNGVVAPNENCEDGNTINGDGCDNNCRTTGCRNGIITAGEFCDDGNNVNGDGCDNNCFPSGCGNGQVGGTEACDDGNGVNGDGCDVNCTATACGNGILAAPEQCEDGNSVSGDGCSATCTIEIIVPPGCGDGNIDAGEDCDDGNAISGDGCDINCTDTGCGNSILTAGEECEDGNTSTGDGCNATCQFEEVVIPPGCGDGDVDAGEDCDDGNELSGDGCDVNCTDTACGNSVLTAGEECEDGNTVNDDGCSSTCAIETVVIPESCGDGTVDDDEDCDDGNEVSGDGCDVNCTETACGNGVLTEDEECEDGNTEDGDGCDADCEIEVVSEGCGNGDVEDGEDCDDGNQVNGDGCDVNCTETGCGNGVLTDGEQCEDGNTEEGDGCDANCDLETPEEAECGNGKVETGEECDDGNTDADDGCSATCTIEPSVEDGSDEAPQGGCGCRMGSESEGSLGAGLAGIAALVGAMARRQKRRAKK